MAETAPVRRSGVLMRTVSSRSSMPTTAKLYPGASCCGVLEMCRAKPAATRPRIETAEAAGSRRLIQPPAFGFMDSFLRAQVRVICRSPAKQADRFQPRSLGTLKMSCPPPASRLIARLLIALVWAYRLTLGFFIGGHCRYWPSCSQYAIDAIHKHGPFRGGWRAVKRIGRCHPFARSGYDPA